VVEATQHVLVSVARPVAAVEVRQLLTGQPTRLARRRLVCFVDAGDGLIDRQPLCQPVRLQHRDAATASNLHGEDTARVTVGREVFT
jgi:hypothetical protein